MGSHKVQPAPDAIQWLLTFCGSNPIGNSSYRVAQSGGWARIVNRAVINYGCLRFTEGECGRVRLDWNHKNASWASSTWLVGSKIGTEFLGCRLLGSEIIKWASKSSAKAVDVGDCGNITVTIPMTAKGQPKFCTKVAQINIFMNITMSSRRTYIFWYQ